MNTVSLVFALVANLILLILIILAIFGYKHRQKLANLIVDHSQIKPLKALEIEGLYTTKAPVTLIQPHEDDTIILRNVAWILMSAIILVLTGVILQICINYTVTNPVLHISSDPAACKEIRLETLSLLISSLKLSTS